MPQGYSTTQENGHINYHLIRELDGQNGRNRSQCPPLQSSALALHLCHLADSTLFIRMPPRSSHSQASTANGSPRSTSARFLFDRLRPALIGDMKKVRMHPWGNATMPDPIIWIQSESELGTDDAQVPISEKANQPDLLIIKKRTRRDSNPKPSDP